MRLEEFAERVHTRLLLGRPSESHVQNQQQQEQTITSFIDTNAEMFQALIQHSGHLQKQSAVLMLPDHLHLMPCPDCDALCKTLFGGGAGGLWSMQGCPLHDAMA